MTASKQQVLKVKRSCFCTSSIAHKEQWRSNKRNKILLKMDFSLIFIWYFLMKIRSARTWEQPTCQRIGPAGAFQQPMAEGKCISSGIKCLTPALPDYLLSTQWYEIKEIPESEIMSFYSEALFPFMQFTSPCYNLVIHHWKVIFCS